MPMAPWWVVLVGSEDAGDRSLDGQGLRDLVDKQLRVWSHRTLGPGGDGWYVFCSWHPERVENPREVIETVRRFVQRENPIVQNAFRNVALNRLGIAIVADLGDEVALHYAHILGRLLRVWGPQLFPGIAGVIQCGFFFLPWRIPEALQAPVLRFLGELHTMMGHRVLSERPFDHVFFIQDANFSGNPGGYPSLHPSDIRAAVAQSLCHWLTGYDQLAHDLAPRQEFNYWASSGVGLYFDCSAYLYDFGRSVGERFIRALGSPHPPFVRDEEADRAVRTLDEFLDVSKLFERVTSGRPAFTLSARLWAPPRTPEGRSLSPWAFWRAELLPVYFRQHLRTFLFRLLEYTRLFLTIHTKRFQAFLKERQKTLWEGTEGGLRCRIDIVLENVLNGGYGFTRTLGQLRRVCERLRDRFEPSGVVGSLEALEDFRRFQVFQVPDFLREFYDRASDRLDPREEARLCDRLEETIRGHPVPSALFLRAALVAVPLAWLGPQVAHALSPQVINLEWLLQVPGLLPALLAAAPMALALWRYGVRTLNQIRKLTRMYVASILRHAQTQAREMVRDTVVALLQQGQHYCDEWIARIDRLVGSLQYPLWTGPRFESTTFFRSVTETIGVPGKAQVVSILANPLSASWEVGGTQKELDQLTDEDISTSLHSFLDTGYPEPLRRRLYRVLQGSSSAESVMDDLRQWVERGLRPSVPETIEDVLRQGALNQQAVSVLQALAWPSVILATGVPADSPSFLVVCRDGDALRPRLQFSAAPVEFRDADPWSDVLYVTGLRPLSQPAQIAAVEAALRAVPSEQVWSSPSPSTTIALTLTDPPVMRGPDGQEVRVPVSAEEQSQIREIPGMREGPGERIIEEL